MRIPGGRGPMCLPTNRSEIMMLIAQLALCPASTPPPTSSPTATGPRMDDVSTEKSLSPHG